MSMKRRDALKAIGALAGAAGTARLLGGCGDNEQVGGIDTYVFLMMENRSYDHYLGARSLLEGLPGDGLRAGMSNPAGDGSSVEIYRTPEDGLCALDPPHGWNASRRQFAEGANSGFQTEMERSHAPGVTDAMSYMTREQVPITSALADHYTSCDRWFSSVLGPTLPNRMYWHAGSSNGAKANDEVYGGAYQGLSSLYHRLDDAGVDWAYYFGDVPVLGVLENLEIEGRLRRFQGNFLADAAAGKLPPVVYVDPAFSVNDDHPPHHPLFGQQLMAAVYLALAQSPQWERTLLVITYDENGGFYDHVAPPKTRDDFAADGFDQLGFRVPTVVCGPYAKAGYVSSTIFDHTSPLKHLQSVYGLEPLGARVDAANDLMDCIDLERLERGAARPAATVPAVEIDESAVPAKCYGSEARTGGHDHDILAWADANRARLGKWDRRAHVLDYVFEISEFLDRNGAGRIRLGR